MHSLLCIVKTKGSLRIKNWLWETFFSSSQKTEFIFQISKTKQNKKIFFYSIFEVRDYLLFCFYALIQQI